MTHYGKHWEETLSDVREASNEMNTEGTISDTLKCSV